jgi:protein SCO1
MRPNVLIFAGPVIHTFLTMLSTMQSALAVATALLSLSLTSAFPGQQPQTSQTAVVSGLTIPDVEVLDQHGNRLHFYTDLVKGKTVAINTIFTTCTTICPMMGADFAQLSKLLAAESPGKLNLISISIDPRTDTPARLDEWSRKFGNPGREWILLTGSKANVDRLLKALQVFSPEKLDHAPVVLIGGRGIDVWIRASALLPPARVADLIRARLPRSETQLGAVR